MCTLAAVIAPAKHPGAERSLLVFANRDEMLARPAQGPFLWPGSPRVVAPRDELAGGTWLGLNEHALFVGITNRAGVRPDPQKRSRGALVADALRAPSAAELHARLADLDPAAHNPFHLLYADRRTAHLTWSDGASLHREDLAPGLHVVTERSFGAAADARSPLLRSLYAELGGDLSHDLSIDRSFDALGAILSRHADDPFAATCVHADAFGYGTRSSLLLALGETWGQTRLCWAEGRPCVTPYQERGDLVARLSSGS